MPARDSRLAPSYALAIAVAAALLGAACTKTETREVYIEDDAAPEPVREAGTTPVTDANPAGDLSVSPSRLHSGFDGEHTFLVPFAVYEGAGDVEVTLEDPDLGDVRPAALLNPGADQGAYYLVTTKKAGTTELVVKSQGRTARATLTVEAYTPARWRAGESRYTTAGANGQPACTKCHAGDRGVDHSPASLVSVDDQGVAAVITTGIAAAGFPIDADDGHKWQVTPTELDGLVAYLRSLPPKTVQ